MTLSLLTLLSFILVSFGIVATANPDEWSISRRHDVDSLKVVVVSPFTYIFYLSNIVGESTTRYALFQTSLNALNDMMTTPCSSEQNEKMGVFVQSIENRDSLSANSSFQLTVSAMIVTSDATNSSNTILDETNNFDMATMQECSTGTEFFIHDFEKKVHLLLRFNFNAQSSNDMLEKIIRLELLTYCVPVDVMMEDTVHETSVVLFSVSDWKLKGFNFGKHDVLQPYDSTQTEEFCITSSMQTRCIAKLPKMLGNEGSQLFSRALQQFQLHEDPSLHIHIKFNYKLSVPAFGALSPLNMSDLRLILQTKRFSKKKIHAIIPLQLQSAHQQVVHRLADIPSNFEGLTMIIHYSSHQKHMPTASMIFCINNMSLLISRAKTTTTLRNSQQDDTQQKRATSTVITPDTETKKKKMRILGHAMDHAPCLPSGTSIHFMNLRSSYSIPSTRCIQLELRPSQENAGAHWSLPQSLEQSEVENALEMLYGIDTLRRHLPVRAIQHAQLFLRHHDQVLEVCFAFDPFVSDWAQTPRATTDPSTLIALSPFAANLLTGMQPSGRHGAHSGLRDEDIVVIVADGARALRVDAAQHTSDGERRVIWVLSALALLFPKSLTNIHLTAMVGSCGCQTYVVRELSSQLGWVFAPLAAITPLLTPGITFEVNALFWNMVLLMYFLIPVFSAAYIRSAPIPWSCFSVYFTNALLTYAITANSYMAYRSLYVTFSTVAHTYPENNMQVVFPIVTIVCIIAVSFGLWIVTKRAVPPRYVQIPALQNQSMSDPSLLGKYGLGWAPLPQRKLRWKMIFPRGEWMPAVKLQQWAHLGLYEASRVWPSSKYTTIAFLHITGTILSGQSSTFTGCYVQSVVFAALSVLKCLWHLGSRPYRWWWSNLSFSLVLFSNALLALMTFVPHSRECQMCTDVQHWLLGDRALAAYYTFVVVIGVLDGIVSFVLMLSDAYFCISIAKRSVSRKDEPTDVDLRELFDVLADSYVPEPMDVLSPTINDSILDRDVAPPPEWNFMNR